MSAPDAHAVPGVLRAQQFALAGYVRDPGHAPPPPGVEARRLQVYRDLFFNSLHGLLAGNFPVIRQVLGDRWRVLVRDFYREYRCTTPLFPELPREFIRYLGERADGERGDPPWLPELAHWEWAELALDISDADPAQLPHDPAGDLLEGVPVPSPLAWALAYTWPVHRLSPAFMPTTAPDEPTFLMVRRDAAMKVRFDQISGLTFRLLQRLSDDGAATGREHLLALADEAGVADREAFLGMGRDMLARLRAEGVVLGTIPA